MVAQQPQRREGEGPDDAALTRIADLQDQVISRAQLTSCSFSHQMIRTLVKRKRLHPQFRGAYSLTKRLTPVGFTRAAVLATDAPASGRSSACVTGLLDRWPEDVHVASLTDLRDRPGLRTHHAPWLTREDIITPSGLACTSVPVTLLQLAATEPESTIFRAANEAQVLEIFNEAEVHALLTRLGPVPGSRQLTEVLHDITIPVVLRSELERVFFDLIRRAALPRPEANVEREGYTPDFVFDDHRLVVEVDGLRFHANARARRRDPRAHNALQLAGYRVLRFEWRTLIHDPQSVTADLIRALAAGAAR